MSKRGALLAAMLIAWWSHSSASACVPNNYTPFVASANVLQADGSWRTVRISAIGALDDDWRFAWTLRVEGAWLNKAALINVISGNALVFPLSENRADDAEQFISVPDAARRFGLSLNVFDADDALDKSEFAPPQDVRRFANRDCAFHLQSSGAWACFDRSGIALAAGPRIGDLTFRVTSFTETRPSRSLFVAPQSPTRSATGNAADNPNC